MIKNYSKLSAVHQFPFNSNQLNRLFMNQSGKLYQEIVVNKLKIF